MANYSVLAVTPYGEDWMRDVLRMTSMLVTKHGAERLGCLAGSERGQFSNEAFPELD